MNMKKSLARKKSLLQETSIPGISHANVRQTQGKFRRTVWLTLFLCGTVLTSIQVSQVLNDYWSYPVNTHIAVHDNGSLPFPAVTVCPVNRVKCSALVKVLQGDLEGDGEAEAEGDGGGGELRGKYCEIGLRAGCLRWMIRDVNETMRSSRMGMIAGMCPSINVTETFHFGNWEDEIEEFDEATLDQVYSDLSRESRIRIGMDHHDLIKGCTVKGSKDCGIYFSRIEVINTVDRGNCFVLNGDNVNDANSVSFKDDEASASYKDNKGIGHVMGGPAEGLTLEIFLSRHQYPWRPSNDLEGLRIVLHNPNEIPLPEENGIDLLPGTASRIAMEVQRLKREPSPYPSKCIRKWSETKMKKVIESTIHDRDYVQATCNRVCLIDYIIKECKCIWHKYDDLNMRDMKRLMRQAPEEYCGFKNEEQQQCIATKLKNYTSSECECRPSCDDISFRTVGTSSLRWPSEASWAYKAHEHNLTYQGEPIRAEHLNLPEDERFLYAASTRADLIKVDIFFANTKEAVIKEVPVYNGLYSLFTAMGGAMSVWMGVSFIMLVEAIELILDLTAKMLRNK